MSGCAALDAADGPCPAPPAEVQHSVERLAEIRPNVTEAFEHLLAELA
jgi:hypothetical protein